MNKLLAYLKKNFKYVASKCPEIEDDMIELNKTIHLQLGSCYVCGNEVIGTSISMTDINTEQDLRTFLKKAKIKLPETI